MPAKHLLILGGTTEARELARRVTLVIGKRVKVTTSLAGRRNAAPSLAGEVRTGGFGGIQGMKDYLGEVAVDLLVDATHPFRRPFPITRAPPARTQACLVYSLCARHGPFPPRQNMLKPVTWQRPPKCFPAWPSACS